MKNQFLKIMILLAFAPNLMMAQTERFEVVKNLEILDMVHEHLQKYYVDEVKTGELSKTGIESMLRELDPYTVYYHEANMEDYMLMATGQYGGIGAIIRKIGDFIVVAEPYEGSPSDKAGMKAGDAILSIDGKNMKGLPSDEVSASLKGPKGSTIAVKVLRGTEEKIINITRDEIKLPDLPYFGMINSSVGYIKLNSFMQQDISADIKKAFLELKGKGMKELVFDLRGNGGGLLIEAVRIVNLFVARDQVIVTCKSRIAEENRIYKTTSEPTDLTIPIVVLVDEGSASASEIVAGSLQDLDRAVIIGQKSYGKGLVQRTFDLKYGTKMKLTIAKYYTPSGRCVQKLEYYDREKGIQPKILPDSLVQTFKTKNGRTVIDARGIIPDEEIKEIEFSKLIAELVIKNMIFNYANDYYRSHPTIADAKTFKLTNEEYATFKAFVLKQEFDYSSSSKDAVVKLKKEFEKEDVSAEATAEYEALLKKLTPSKETDLTRYQPEIVRILESEIVGRYYYSKGRIEHSFDQDNEMKKATEVLANQKQYKQILNVR